MRARIVASILFLAVLVSTSVIMPLTTAYAASSSVTLILRIDKARFSSRAVEALGGKLIYVADLAPVAIVSMPGKAVGLLKKLPGVLHVSMDGEVKTLEVRVNAPLPWGVVLRRASQQRLYLGVWTTLTQKGCGH